MAKAIGLIGNYKGKLGNTVGYRLVNSRNRVSQGVRAYQSEISNPKSTQQAIQRMKMAPATTFYRAFLDPINHSFEGKRVGGGSRQQFMKLALAAGANTVPSVVKGTTGVVPGKYVVSDGSLGKRVVKDLSTSSMITDIMLGADAFDNATTWGDMSKVIIDNNIGISDGDELCFLFLYNDGNDSYFPAVGYIVLDVNSEATPADLGGLYVAVSDAEVSGVNFLEIALPTAQQQSLILDGAAVIQSRRPRSAGGSWLRSQSQMVVSTDVTNKYFSPAAYAEALDSYKASAAAYDSDLTLNQAGDDASASGSQNAEVRMKNVPNKSFQGAYSYIDGAIGFIGEREGLDIESYVWKLFEIAGTNTLRKTANTLTNAEWTTLENKVAKADFLTAATGWMVIN